MAWYGEVRHEYVPCRKYDKRLDKWVPIDYDPRDSV
jgi:hypothetical protein